MAVIYWCNIYCCHSITIAKQLQDLIKKFSMLDHWSKKRNENVLQKKKNLLLLWTNFLYFLSGPIKKKRIGETKQFMYE